MRILGYPGMSTVTEVTKENELKGKIIDVVCASCKSITRHEVIQSFEKKKSEEITGENSNFSFDWSDSYQIAECRGCASISFVHDSWFSENEDSEQQVYPQRSLKTMSVKEFLNTPYHLRRIYRETVDAFNYGSFTLCAAGLRAVVEGICSVKEITDGPVTKLKDDGTTFTKRYGNLEGKIAGLSERGVLTVVQAQTLHEHRFLGNDALHELKPPSSDDVLMALKIIEHVLDGLFEIPITGEELREKRQRREEARRRVKSGSDSNQG